MSEDQDVKEEDLRGALEREREKTRALVSILDQTIAALAQVSGQVAAISQAFRGK